MIISGMVRLGREPKMQYTNDGLAVTHVQAAGNSGFGDNKKTTWFDFVAFGKQAEVLNEKLSKGNRVVMTAEFQEVSTYEKKDGTTGTEVKARVLDFSFIDYNQTEGEPEEF